MRKFLRRGLWGLISAALSCVLLYGCCGVPVDEREFAVVTLFGEVRKVAREPGLVLINPLESVMTISKQLQEWTQEEPTPTVTGDKKNLMVSYFLKYRVTDPMEYAMKVRNPARANQTIDDIVYSELKAAVSKRPLADVIGGRNELDRSVLLASREQVKSYGVDLVDFRIKRTDLPTEVLNSVHRRMQAERAQMAQTYRSEGQKASMGLIADATRKETEILSEAYRQEQEIRGQGDAEALRLLREAYGQDQEFALFVRSLDLYKAAFAKGSSQVVLTTGSELMKYLVDPGKK